MTKFFKKLQLLLPTVVIIATMLGMLWTATTVTIKLLNEQTVASQGVVLRELTQREQYKLYLYKQLNYNFKAYKLLSRIINCESGWQQFRKDGLVVISKGNIGLGQINRLAHEKTYTRMGLNMADPYDNLKFTVFLYRRDGVGPWLSWSGWCWNK